MRVRIHIIFGFVFLLFGCAPKVFNYESVKKDDLYFPSKQDSVELGLKCQLNSSTNKWYSRNLHCLDEPILFKNKSKGYEVYRFTHIPTWSGASSYRIQKKDSVVQIEYSHCSGQGGYEAGRLYEWKNKKLTIKDWIEFQKMIDSLCFWRLEANGERRMFDGETYILEGLIEGEYHFVERDTPNQFEDTTEFAKVCSFLEELYYKN